MLFSLTFLQAMNVVVALPWRYNNFILKDTILIAFKTIVADIDILN